MSKVAMPLKFSMAHFLAFIFVSGGVICSTRAAVLQSQGFWSCLALWSIYVTFDITLAFLAKNFFHRWVIIVALIFSSVSVTYIVASNIVTNTSASHYAMLNSSKIEANEARKELTKVNLDAADLAVREGTAGQRAAAQDRAAAAVEKLEKTEVVSEGAAKDLYLAKLLGVEVESVAIINMWFMVAAFMASYIAITGWLRGDLFSDDSNIIVADEQEKASFWQKLAFKSDKKKEIEKIVVHEQGEEPRVLHRATS